MGLSGALATSARSLEIFTTGIEVAGNNIANANTPGYVREELTLKPSPDFRDGNTVLGTGALVDGVRQQIDLFLELRLNSSITSASEAAAVDGIYKQLETAINELGDSDLSTSLTDFLAAINDLVNAPDSIASREFVVQAGEQLAGDIRALRSRVDEIRVRQNVTIDGIVAEANTLIQQIATLNPQIARLEAAGQLSSDAGSLRSDRYEAMRRLSEMIPVRFRENTDGSVDVFSNSDYLVLFNQTQQLETVTTSDRQVAVQSVRLSVTKADISTNGGQLAGVIEGRDTILGSFVDDLDALAGAIVFEFNKLHASGQGLEGYQQLVSGNSVDDTTADLNSTTANLSFTPVHGGFDLRVTNRDTGITSTVAIDVDLDGIGTDDGLDDLRTKLDAVANVTATITTDGRLQLDAATGYEFTFADDTSGVLAALGINTFFTGSDSSTIGLNGDITSRVERLAAAQGGGPSDGSNALAMTRFHETELTTLGGTGIEDYYQNSITEIARGSASRATILAGRNDFRDSLEAQRTQFSGVSIDEEAIRILQYQRSYQAAARVISTVDELFTTLLNM